MARRGFLDYVLSGAVGGLEGLAQQRAAEDEKKRIADALERQGRMDAMTAEDRATEKEDREQSKKDRLRSQRQSLLAGGYLPTGRDMPGATRRQPVSTETVDGQEFALYSTPRQLALQTAMEEAQLKARFKPEFRTPISTVGETGVSLINPETGKTQFVKFPAGFTPKKASAGDENKAGIGKIIANAGRILETAREEERRAQTQLDNLDRIRPDPNRFSGTDEKFAADEAAWQKKVDAAQRRLDEAQAKVGRTAPVYNMGALANDTTGFGEAFRDRPPAPPSTRSFDLFSPTANDKKFGTAFGAPAATPKPAPQAPGNTKEDALAKQASAMVQQWMKSGAPKEEISAAVSKINNRLANEIRALRSGGK
jgi:hypothetical protein